MEARYYSGLVCNVLFKTRKLRRHVFLVSHKVYEKAVPLLGDGVESSLKAGRHRSGAPCSARVLLVSHEVCVKAVPLLDDSVEPSLGAG